MLISYTSTISLKVCLLITSELCYVMNYYLMIDIGYKNRLTLLVCAVSTDRSLWLYSLLLNVNDFEILFLQDINELKVNYQLVM